jgi:hypothetical protein
METSLKNTGMRELDGRSGDGIEVRLVWDAQTDRVYVAVDDERTGDRFQIRVDAAAALDAFHHPYAYDHRSDDHGLAEPASVEREWRLTAAD